MQAPKTKILTVALAALMVLGTLDSASARQEESPRHAAGHGQRKCRHVPGQLVPVDRTARRSSCRATIAVQDARQGADEPPTEQRADRPIHIPRGSSTYIPPPNPSPYSSNSPPAAALTQPAPAPYQPPPITTFSDKVNNAIQAYPLENGIGNNPTDQQQFIRQRVNQ